MIIAIVGSPLSGKTELLRRLSMEGVKVFHTDSYITKIYKKGKIGYETILKNLGLEYVNEIEVNRKELAKFASIEGNLEKLNNLIHPLIKEYLKNKDNYIAELPIITNSNIKFNFDKIILVKASPKKIKERLLKTKLKNPEFIKKLIDDWNNKIDFDYIVDTTNNISDLDISNIIKMLNEK